LNFELITDPVLLRTFGWEAFVASHPEGTVFQSPDMYELFSLTANMKPVAVGVQDKTTGSLAGILLGVVIREMKGPLGYFSSRTVVYGGPLVVTTSQGDRERVVELLLEELIRRVKNRSVFIQFRNFADLKEYRKVFFSFGFRHRDRLNLLVDTSGPEIVRKNMSPSRWRQIRKGLGQLGSGTVGQLDSGTVGQWDSGENPFAEIISPENIGQVREFYDILLDLYRHKVKKPLPGWDFFEAFYHLSSEGKLGVIKLVKYRGRIIGGILSPVTPGKTIYEWYVCGLDQQYREAHPSVLATWAAIDHALQNGIPQFDFMGVGIPEREYGVREFKMRFGGKTVNFGRFARINNKTVYTISEIGFNILTLLKKI
jgi:hypothetical protein